MYKCNTCNKDDCKLYRSYGSFLRTEEIFCLIHIPIAAQDWYVPLIQDYLGDGGIWGYTSVPQSDIDIWNKLPDNVG